MTTLNLTGRCLCRAVTVEVEAVSTDVDACHCGMCRNWSGGPLLAVESNGAVQFSGEDYVSVFSSSDWAERGFCSQCGTHLFYRLKEGHHYALPVGLFDDSAPFDFTKQIFIDKKPAYYSFANQTQNMTGDEVFAQFSSD